VVQPTSRTRILLVDDEQSIRLTLPRILAKYSFDITSVSNVEDALTEIRAEHFDVLLCDLNLPEVNAGFAVIKAMRDAQPTCINFVLTEDPPDLSFESKGRYGIAHDFAKPVHIEEMVRIIQRRVADAAAEQAGPRLKYPWQRSVLNAFTEGRTDELPLKIDVAEHAILARLCELTPAESDERTALQDALSNLGLVFTHQSQPRYASRKEKEIA